MTDLIAVSRDESLPEFFGAETPLKAMIDWQHIVIRDPLVNVVALCHHYMEQLAKESCGRCSPCPGGTRAMADILHTICQGEGQTKHLEQLQTIAQTVMATSRCGIGQDGPGAILYGLKHFRDAFIKALASGAKNHVTYKSKTTAPCMEACPLHLNIPEYIDLIREGAFDNSLDLICSRLPLAGVLGRTCFRPCESSCRRANMDEAIAIKSLKRFVADEVRQKSAYNASSILQRHVDDHVGNVASIGAGPAGLSCAYHLALLNHNVTIYEMLNEPGGMAAVGIPDYRLPRTILREESERIQALGVTIHYGVTIGQDKMLSELIQDYDAVFVAVGAQGSTSVRVEGEDNNYLGYIPGVQYLRGINDGYDPYPEGRRVAVIGGGNVALDCVRTALRMDKDDVSLLYRRTRSEMPADRTEIHEADEENVSFHFLVAPTRMVAEHGRIVGLECQRMELGPADASGRRSPVVIPDSEFIFECDTIVSAIGQRVDLSFLAGHEGIATTRWDTLDVNPVTRQSSVAKLFAAGDCETGPDALVTAAAGGLRAAQSIHEFIGGSHPVANDDDAFNGLMKHVQLYDPKEELDQVAPLKRQAPSLLPADIRTTSYDEVEQVFTRDEAQREASRCLRCYRLVTVAI